MVFECVKKQYELENVLAFLKGVVFEFCLMEMFEIFVFVCNYDLFCSDGREELQRMRRELASSGMSKSSSEMSASSLSEETR